MMGRVMRHPLQAHKGDNIIKGLKGGRGHCFAPPSGFFWFLIFIGTGPRRRAGSGSTFVIGTMMPAMMPHRCPAAAQCQALFLCATRAANYDVCY